MILGRSVITNKIMNKETRMPRDLIALFVSIGRMLNNVMSVI